MTKPEGEFWVTYAGTLGASYDLETLINAAALIKQAEEASGPALCSEVVTSEDTCDLKVRVKILGDGPNRAALEQLAQSLNAPVDFLGYCPYDLMAAYLTASDVTVNSLKKDAAQSIVTKIGDYLAAGKPMINTGSSEEFLMKVKTDGFGVNVVAEDAQALADAITDLTKRPNRRRIMGTRARDVAYAGTLGASYDLETLINAAALIKQAEEASGPALCSEVVTSEDTCDLKVRVKILGDGPNRAALEQLAQSLNAPVDFLGYCPYDLMAAYLTASDVTVNSLKKDAAQSIVTKIGDYLAAGKPMINTGSSEEFLMKVKTDGFGVNVVAEDAQALADAITDLTKRPNRRRIMGTRARDVAVAQFDQDHSYLAIVKLIRNLTK